MLSHGAGYVLMDLKASSVGVFTDPITGEMELKCIDVKGSYHANPIPSYLNTPYHTTPHLISSRLTIPHHIITTPHYTTPHHTTPYHTIPYHTTPYHNTTPSSPYHNCPCLIFQASYLAPRKWQWNATKPPQAVCCSWHRR